LPPTVRVDFALKLFTEVMVFRPVVIFCSRRLAGQRPENHAAAPPFLE
jgi:hypothetical protein